MKIISKIKNKLNNKVQSFLHTQLLNRWSNPPTRGASEWERLYHTNPRMNPVRRIAQDVASVNWFVKDSRDNIVENTALTKLIKKPNPIAWFTWYNINYIKEVHLLVNGEAFWVTEKNSRGEVEEIWIVPPSWVRETPTIGSDFFIISPPHTTDIHVQSEDMIYFIDINASDPFGRGVGQVKQIGDEIETDEYMSRYAKKFFYNDATPPVTITAPNAQASDIERLQSKWNERSGGLINAHKPMILPWDAKIQILKQTEKEMDFIESRKFLRDMSNQNFNIPPEIMGIIENSNRATIDSAYTLYAKNVLTSRLMLTKDVFNNQLINDERLAVEYENIIPEDKEFNLKVANEGFKNGAITKNEWRISNGYEKTAKGDVYHIPFTFIEVEAKNDNKKIIKKKEYNEKQKLILWKTFDNIVLQVSKKLEIEMNNFFEAQAELLRKKTIQLLGNKSIQAKQGLPEIFLEAIFNFAEQNEELKKLLLPFILEASSSGVSETIELYKLQIESDFVEKNMVDWWDNYAGTQAYYINDTTQKIIKKEVRNYLEEGLSVTQLADNIKKKIVDIGKSRAVLIARTESHNAVQGGVYNTYKDADIPFIKWLTSKDERVRSSHEAIDGQIRRRGELFSNGLKYPGDSSGSLSEFERCRCVLIIPELEESLI